MYKRQTNLWHSLVLLAVSFLIKGWGKGNGLVSSLYTTCATTTIDLSQCIWSPPPVMVNRPPRPRILKYTASLPWIIHVSYQLYENVCPPGSYILNHISKYAVHSDHSLRYISFGGLLISKYCTGIWSLEKRVLPKLLFSNCVSEMHMYSLLYCIVLQGDFSVTNFRPGVSSVLLVLAKLQITAGYTPVITYSMANSNNCFPSVSPLGSRSFWTLHNKL